MSERVPNLVSALGYTNASWTLKCDLTSKASPSVISCEGYCDKSKFEIFRWGIPSETLDFGLWTFLAYVKDLSMLRFGCVDDSTMEFKLTADNCQPPLV